MRHDLPKKIQVKPPVTDSYWYQVFKATCEVVALCAMFCGSALLFSRLF